MVYISPIVFTGSSPPFTITMLTITAIREGGILAKGSGTKRHNIRIARHTAPTANAHILKVGINSNTALSFSVVSISGSSVTTSRPKKSFICPTNMVMAIPVVKPVVMV